MNLNILFKIMLRGIAKELSLQFIETERGVGNFISNGKKSVGFTSFVDMKWRLVILMSPEGRGAPINLGKYTREELEERNSKARRAIIAKLKNLEFL